MNTNLLNPSLDDRIQQLRAWEDAYYNGQPLVTDNIYDRERDALVAELRQNSPNHPYLDEVGAPRPTGSVWPKYTHSEVMGSLEKVKTEAEFLAWIAGKGDKFILSEKADGATVVAYYTNGRLTAFVSRGDGYEGEDITPNARYLENVALRLPIAFTGVLRGEVILPLHKFHNHFATLGMANPRNAASGKVRDTKNPHLKRHLRVKWFDVMTSDENFITWEDKFDFIEQCLKLKTIWRYKFQTPRQIWDLYHHYLTEKRAKLNYWIDGLVVRISNLTAHDALGVTNKRPKGSVAIKFPATGENTTLLSVEFNRGRSGRIAPVGIIASTLIDGSTINRVSIHGADWIDAMGLQIGDEVEVAKAGDIIPQITQVVTPGLARQPIVFPSVCPDCDTNLVRNGAYYECRNQECPGEIEGKLAKWLEKTKIKGIGASILEQLALAIDDVDQLYTAKPLIFAQAAGSDKIGDKLYAKVQATKTIDLATFLSALHISTLGSTNGQKLAQHFKTLDRVLQAPEYQLRQVDGIAENASKIHEGLLRKADLIQKLRNLLTIEDVPTGKFTGKSFAITGTLNSGRKRSEVEKWIKDQGGTIKGIGRGLDYLITDDPHSGSDKNLKADKYGIAKITEAQLRLL